MENIFLGFILVINKSMPHVTNIILQTMSLQGEYVAFKANITVMDLQKVIVRHLLGEVFMQIFQPIRVEKEAFRTGKFSYAQGSFVRYFGT